MQLATQAFLNYLRVERNASALTIKSYADDLTHVAEFFQEQTGAVPEPRFIDVGSLRSYVAWLHECGYARTTVARRLACLRSYFKYCTREGLCETNPAKPLRTPRSGRKLPHFLTTEQVGTLLATPPANIQRSPSRPSRSPLRHWRPRPPVPPSSIAMCATRRPARALAESTCTAK